MARHKKKFNLNTIVREAILRNRYKENETDVKFDFDWDELKYNRKAVVSLLLSTTAGQRYLEIGCAGDELFDSVMALNKVGVDPARGGTHRMTSDAFFASYVGEPFDVVFIDGLHLYDQVRRDLDGALRNIRPGGWIALHDMLPRDWFEEHVPQIRTKGWTGDGWKVAFELLASSDIDFRLITIDFGVLVVRPLTQRPIIPDLRDELESKRFGYLHQNFGRLPTTDYPGAAEWITSCHSVAAMA